MKTSKAHQDLSLSREADLLHCVIQSFEGCFYSEFQTRLIAGADEPFYRAPKEGLDGSICFRLNYLRSALHECAHWCLAGNRRLKLDDWGYWYEPDGRNLEQQSQFFEVEVKPQAIEKAFCNSLDIPFEVSVDNLGGPAGPIEQFASSVEDQYELYKKQGFPKRAEIFRKALLGSKKALQIGERGRDKK